LAENLAINSVNQIANPVFNLTLGVSPLLVGTALALPRLWDVIGDPWIGSLSDNFNSRWGRRRPFILVGAIFTGICAAAIWYFPPGRSHGFYFGWLTVSSLALAISYSFFVVPYGALGLELATDYHERTRLMATKSVFSKTSGIINQWLLKLVQLAGRGNLASGSRFCGAILGGVVAAFGAITACRVTERKRAIPRTLPKLSLWRGWRETVRRPDFLRLIVAQVFIYASVLVIDNTGFYLNVFYVNHGNMAYGALLKGIAGMTFQVGGMLAIPGIVWLSRRLGKKRTFILCAGSIAVAGVAKWFCYVPGAGWWLALPSLLMAPGLVAASVLAPSMTADICDLDEVVTGRRREGMFNAVLGWTTKLAVSGSIFLAGLTLELTGWRTKLGAAQSPATFLAMRLAFSGGTILLAGCAACAILGYDVTAENVIAARKAVVDELTVGPFGPPPSPVSNHAT